MAFCYAKVSDNLLSNASITVSSAVAAFPALNMLSMPVSKRGRVGATTGSVLLELPSDISPDTFSIVNHNFTSSAVVTVKAGASPSPSTVVFSFSWSKKNLHKFLDAALSYRYWTIEVSDASNPHGFLSIGYIMFCVRTSASFSFLAAHRRTIDQVVVKGVTESEDERTAYVGSRDSYVLPFSDLNKTQHDVIDSLVDDCKESNQPIFLIPEDSEEEGIFGRFESDHRTRYSAGLISTRDLVFVEEPATSISISP